MIMKFKFLIIFCIFYTGCAFTLTAPLKALKKSESKHTFYSLPPGYQYQRGISDALEIGFDFGFNNIGGNLRYHLDESERSLKSIQLGLGRRGIHVNYMYTFKTGSATYIRLGPISSYLFGRVFTGSGGSSNRTLRTGASFTYGGNNLWISIGYSHPVFTNYHIQESLFFENSLENQQYGNPIYSLEVKLGASF